MLLSPLDITFTVPAFHCQRASLPLSALHIFFCLLLVVGREAQIEKDAPKRTCVRCRIIVMVAIPYPPITS